MTEAQLKNWRHTQNERAKAKHRALYPRDAKGDAVPQLPPPRGHRRPEFSRPLRKVNGRSAWGLA